jgi:hypothetical protein
MVRKKSIKGERITVPLFEIVSCPKISLKDLRNYRYNPLYGGSKLTEEELEEYRISSKNW